MHGNFSVKCLSRTGRCTPGAVACTSGASLVPGRSSIWTYHGSQASRGILHPAGLAWEGGQRTKYGNSAPHGSNTATVHPTGLGGGNTPNQSRMALAWHGKRKRGPPPPPAGDMDGACKREPGAQAAARRSLEAGLEHRRRLPARLSDPRAFLCLRARPQGFPGLASSGRFVPLPVPELFPELLECWVIGRPTGRPRGFLRPRPIERTRSIARRPPAHHRRLKRWHGARRGASCPGLFVVSPHRIVAWIV
jgi:hypothetical protein